MASLYHIHTYIRCSLKLYWSYITPTDIPLFCFLMVLFESLFHGKRKVWLRSQPALAGIIVNFISVACPLLDKDIFVKTASWDMKDLLLVMAAIWWSYITSPVFVGSWCLPSTCVSTCFNDSEMNEETLWLILSKLDPKRVLNLIFLEWLGVCEAVFWPANFELGQYW